MASKILFNFYSQNIQKNFLIAVTLIHSFFLAKSPIAPNTKPAMNRAKYGKLASMPACDNLKPRTFKKSYAMIGQSL